MTNQNPLSKLMVGIPSFVIEDLNNTTMPCKSGRENNVAESLLQIAQNTSEECDSRTDEFLNVVCHKLSVHQIVRTSYDMQWRLAIQKTPLEGKWWPLMLFLLIRKCTSEKPSKGTLGLQLKRINAAFSGIDVARGLGVNESKIQQLTQLAEQRLRELIE
jgi:hypothetical protein